MRTVDYVERFGTRYIGGGGVFCSRAFQRWTTDHERSMQTWHQVARDMYFLVCNIPMTRHDFAHSTNSLRIDIRSAPRLCLTSLVRSGGIY